VEFVFLPGEANDTRGLKALPLNLPPSSSIYCDAGYTDYQAEDAICLRFLNSRRDCHPRSLAVKKLLLFLLLIVQIAIAERDLAKASPPFLITRNLN
jgi:hypothetical protein